MLRVASRGGSTRKATVESGTTELTRLPGLEVPEVPVPQASGERGRWIERGPSGKLMLFSGRSNPELSERIAELLNISLGEVELETFANGETYCRYCESIRGADVFLIQSCHGLHSNDHLMELMIMIQAAKLASANRITAVMPWYPYSRQDKKSAPRDEPFSSAVRRRGRRKVPASTTIATALSSKSLSHRCTPMKTPHGRLRFVGVNRVCIWG